MPQSTDGEIVEFAQAATAGAESIGQITVLQGTVTITRADGTKVKASDGAPIFQGDVIETGSGALGITFADDSVFSLAEQGRMTIDEMIYDPGTQSGKSAIGLTSGVFTFVSGHIAKTDVEAMTITTPVAVIGIRGTAGGGKAAPEGNPNTFTMFSDPGGGTGEMNITTLGGVQTLSTPNQTTQISSAYVPPTIPVTLPASAVARFYANAKAVAPPPPTSPGVTGGGATGDEAAEDGPTEAEVAEAVAEAEAAAAAEAEAVAEAEALAAEAEVLAAEAEAAAAAAAEAEAAAAVAEGAEVEAAEAKAAELAAEAESTAAAAEAQATEAEAAQAKAVAAEAVHAEAKATVEARAQAVAAFEGPGPGGPGPEGPGPGGLGPEGPGPGGFSTIIEAGEQAAEAAFDQAMLTGGSLEDAFFAATTAATQAGFEAVLDANPTFYGTDKSIKSVLNSVADNVILKLTGNIDLLSAGTGNGVGYNDATQRNSQNEIGHLTEDAVGEIAGTFFENFLGEGAFVDEGDKFFEALFDDPFSDFQDEFSFAEENFFGPDVFGPDVSGPEDGFFFFDEGPNNFISDGFVFGDAPTTATDTQSGVPIFSIGDATLSESAGTATFTVTRSGITTGASTVDFGTSSGTATSGTDFTAGSGTLSFAAGETSKSIAVSISSDSAFETAETFSVNLSNASGGATISDALGSGKITNDDTTFGLSTLDGSNGFVINGIDATDLSGGAVSSAGDVNGDGFDDLIIGAYGADPGGRGTAGESYVVFGKSSSFSASLNLSALDGSDGFRLDGITANDQSGIAVSSAGDVNGDGFDDLIIGAKFASPGGSGESYVVFGKSSSFSASLNLSALDGSDGFVLNGITAGDQSGRSVSGAGDVNGDGFDDLIIGGAFADPGGVDRAGKSHVVFGGDFTGAVSFLGDDGANTLTGTAAAENFVAGQGDDTITAGGGNDVIRGGAGNDTLIGGAGNDLLDGGSGTDTVDFSAATGAVAVNLGSTLSQSIGGGEGSDRIFDVENVIGSSQGDTLTGGFGANSLTGGGGSDIFRYTATTDSAVGSGDTITDFNATDNSEDILLSGLLSGTFSFVGASTNSFSGSSNTSARFNDSTKLLQIDTNGDGSADMDLTLSGVSLTDLDASDFTVSS